MNIYVSALLRGLTQGLSEFLPISSSGHLLMLSSLGLWEENLFTDIMLHIATLAVVIIVFRKELISIIKHPLQGDAKFILIATVPTAILAGLIRYFVKDYMTMLLPYCFLINGLLLLMTKFINSGGKKMSGQIKPAVLVGLFQGVACMSGISRSGTVFLGTKVIGMEKEKSASSVFLLSIPIIIGSALVEGIAYKSASEIVVPELIIAMLTAFVSGFIAVKTFTKMLKSDKIWYFSFYSFLIAIAAFFIIK